MSKETKIALIGAAATVLAAIITGIFLLHSTASGQPNASSTSPLVSSTSAFTQSNSSATFPPVATQPAQPSYPDIRETYTLNIQNSATGTSSDAFALDITQQNQQNFQGSVGNSNGSSPINDGTVDQNGNIRFTTLGCNSSYNPVIVTFTGTAQNGGGWQGTWSGSNGTGGTWSAK